MKTKTYFLWAALMFSLIHSAWAQPIIVQQPRNLTNVAGTTATFSVFVVGMLPVSYQWRSYSPDGSSFTDIPFAVNATYVLPNVQPTTNLFAVVVTDGSGLSVTSSPLVTLTVLVPPVITMQPQSQTNVVGSMVTLAVEAGGTPPLSYQWRRNSANLAGKTDPTLVFTNLQTGNAGSYTVVVTNMEGAVTSVVAFVRVLVPPSITSQPATQLVVVGSTVTFAVTAAGTAPLGYQWRFNDVNLAGQITTSLVLANAQRTDAGNYSVVVTNAVGSVTSRVALLTFPSHSFDRIAANPDRTISLSLAGVVPIAFTPYYDLYPLDASTNFMDWSPLVMLQRTNSSSNALVYLDRDGTNFEKRFYRTHTNALITPLPKPSGPYPVGTVSRLLTDPSRSNRYNIATNSSFMVTIWYPAEARAGVLPEAYVESNATLHGYLNTRNPSIVAQFVSHALPGLPVATNQSSFPVVIYSHGGGFRRQNTDKALELASHGYVVVAVDHMWTTASVFPNGQVVIGQTVICADPKSCFQPFLDDGINDFRFVLDELGRLNLNDTLFAGRLDLERLGAFGFSAGAVPVAEFCRIDTRCKAVALLDGGPLLEAPTDLIRLGLSRPFLSMNSHNPSGRPAVPAGYNPEWLSASLVLFTNSINDAFWCQIQDATHQSFQDRGSLISDPARTADPTPVSREQSRTIRACLLSFFDKYLKNQDDHLLDNPAAVHPNIINFQRK